MRDLAAVRKFEEKEVRAVLEDFYLVVCLMSSGYMWNTDQLFLPARLPARGALDEDLNL